MNFAAFTDYMWVTVARSAISTNIYTDIHNNNNKSTREKINKFSNKRAC